MGANAQTTVPTFTAGEVLTAAQQNASARTGVPVFATTTTRDAGFGGTGEKTLAEGQLCYVEGTGLQSYNGTSWVTWGAAPSSGAMTLISATTIGSAVTSVTVNSAFSATYDNYIITLADGTASGGIDLRLTLGATATGYYSFQVYGDYTATTVSGSNQNNATYWQGAAVATANGQRGYIILNNPYLAKNTTFSAIRAEQQSTGNFRWTQGLLDNTTSYTAFTLTVSAGTMTGGVVRVYGLANS